MTAATAAPSLWVRDYAADVGPCGVCRRLTTRYGVGGEPLCRGCRTGAPPAALDPWRWLPVADSLPLPDAAALYARHGWPVFPVVPGGKAPLGRLAPNGCRSASTDPAVVAAWWADTPDANVGVATGAVTDVLDVDTDAGKPGGLSAARLEAAGLLTGWVAACVTPTGGRHLHYPAAGLGNAARSGTLGLDVRGAGGYVVAPPSTRDGGSRYRWTHVPGGPGGPLRWDAMTAHLTPPAGPGPRPARPVTVGEWSGVVARLAAAVPGERNHLLNWAAGKVAREGGDPVLVLRDAADACGLIRDDGERAYEATCRSAVKWAGGAR